MTAAFGLLVGLVPTSVLAAFGVLVSVSFVGGFVGGELGEPPDDRVPSRA